MVTTYTLFYLRESQCLTAGSSCCTASNFTYFHLHELLAFLTYGFNRQSPSTCTYFDPQEIPFITDGVMIALP